MTPSTSGTLDRTTQQIRSAAQGTRRRVLALVILALVAATVAIAGPFARSAAVVDGPVVDPAPSWAAAVITPETMCAGALVSPNVVLTVKHCDAPSGSQVFVGRSDLRNNTEGVVTGLARKIDFPPEGGDLAALILDRSVPLTPIPLGSDDPISAEMSFIPFTVYGYGRTNDATEPKPIIDGRLRSAVGEVTTCGEYRVSKFTFCLTPQKTSAPCQGDSGGPLVASGHLMGLHHTHIIENSHTCYGGTWAATSVPNSEIKKWVDDVIAANPSSS